MLKFMIGLAVGFGVFYLYQNPGVVTGLMDVVKTGVNSTASTIVEVTD